MPFSFNCAELVSWCAGLRTHFGYFSELTQILNMLSWGTFNRGDVLLTETAGYNFGHIVVVKRYDDIEQKVYCIEASDTEKRVRFTHGATDLTP